jgi:hypothetical protein
MAFGYTLLKTEDLEEDKRLFYGYDTSTGGMILHLRLERKATDGNSDMKVIDAEVFLPGDQIAGMGSISFTTLADDDLGRGMRRIVRAYVTPAGHVLMHRYSRATFSWVGTTRTLYVDEHLEVIAHASLSGTDVVRAMGAGQTSQGISRVSVTSANSYSGSGSWQDVKVAGGGANLQLVFTAKEGDSLDAGLSLACENTLGTTFSVDSRIALDGAEIARSRRRVGTYVGSEVDLSVHGKVGGLSAGSHTLKAQVLVGGGFTTIEIKAGTHLGKLEMRRFSG